MLCICFTWGVLRWLWVIRLGIYPPAVGFYQELSSLPPFPVMYTTSSQLSATENVERVGYAAEQVYGAFDLCPPTMLRQISLTLAMRSVVIRLRKELTIRVSESHPVERSSALSYDKYELATLDCMSELTLFLVVQWVDRLELLVSCSPGYQSSACLNGRLTKKDVLSRAFTAFKPSLSI